MIEEKLYARLASINQNVFPSVMDTNAPFPAVVYNRMSSSFTRDISDDLHDTMFVTFNIDVYSPDAVEAKILSSAIRASMLSWDDPSIDTVAIVNEMTSADDTTATTFYRRQTIYRLFCTSE